MKVGIFYFSERWAIDRDAVYDSESERVIPIGYVRVEVVEAKSLDDALDHAIPRSDEAVMNTHELPEGA